MHTMVITLVCDVMEGKKKHSPSSLYCFLFVCLFSIYGCKETYLLLLFSSELCGK